MNDERSPVLILIVRLCIAIPVLLMGFFMMFRNPGLIGLIFGAPLIILAAIIAAPPLSNLLADTVTGIFYPKRRIEDTGPVYSGVDADCQQGEYQSAIQKCRQLAEAYPDDPGPYERMMTIAANDLHDPEQTKTLLNEAFTQFDNPTQQVQLKAHFDSLVKAHAAAEASPTPAKLEFEIDDEDVIDLK